MHHHKRWKNEKTDSADDADVTWCKAGDTVTVAANGEDEDAAIETLKAFSKQTCKSTLEDKNAVFSGEIRI